jgi:hypothetical protein
MRSPWRLPSVALATLGLGVPALYAAAHLFVQQDGSRLDPGETVLYVDPEAGHVWGGPWVVEEALPGGRVRISDGRRTAVAGPGEFSPLDRWGGSSRGRAFHGGTVLPRLGWADIGAGPGALPQPRPG